MTTLRDSTAHARSFLRATPGRWTARLALVVLCFVGCDSWLVRNEPMTPIDDRLPRLDEIESRLPPPRPQDQLAHGPQTRIGLLRIDLQGEQTLSKAWSIVEQRGVEPALGSVWRNNGLRAAVLHRSLYDAFVEALPKAIGVRRLSLLTSQAPAVLDFTPSTQSPRTVTLTLSGGMETDVELPDGSTRLLITTEPADDDSILVALTPHHHWPRLTVKPRTLLEKQLDGRSFNLLRLQTRLRRDEVLIIGVPHPAPPEVPEVAPPQAARGLAPSPDEPAPTTQPADETETPTTQPAKEYVPPFTKVEVEPLRLGRLILEGIKHKRHVQMVLIISIEQ